jgi:hypothetical protein
MRVRLNPLPGTQQVSVSHPERMFAPWSSGLSEQSLPSIVAKAGPASMSTTSRIVGWRSTRRCSSTARAAQDRADGLRSHGSNVAQHSDDRNPSCGGPIHSAREFSSQCVAYVRHSGHPIWPGHSPPTPKEHGSGCSASTDATPEVAACSSTPFFDRLRTVGR